MQKAVYLSSVLLPESLSSCMPCPFGAFTVSPEFRPFTVVENKPFSTSIKLHSVLVFNFLLFYKKSQLLSIYSMKIFDFSFLFFRKVESFFSLSFKSHNGCATAASILWSIAKTLDMLVSLQVFGDSLTNDTCSDTMDDVDLRHIV